MYQEGRFPGEFDWLARMGTIKIIRRVTSHIFMAER
jgi:hypothetical protein